ncbi:MAG: DEAD/DEAH box helicase family protein, partial [Bacteroidota bacterium]|nr:DEAD/DEAH box helicase family protein [Bacteroidota bacterium]
MSFKLPFQEAEAYDNFQGLFVEVILPMALPQSYTYRVPRDHADKIAIGKRIVVQFGKKKVFTALVIEVHQRPPKDYTAKYLLDVLDEKPVITAKQIEFWNWIANYYCCTLGEVMDAALPAHMKLKSETMILPNSAMELNPVQLSEKEYQVLECLSLQSPLTVTQISELLGVKTALPYIKSLYEKGNIFLKEELDNSHRPKIEAFVLPAKDFSVRDIVKNTLDELEKAPKQSDILLAYLKLAPKQKGVIRRKLLKAANAPSAALDALIKKGHFILEEKEVDRLEIDEAEGWNYALNDYQKEALGEIKAQFQKHNVVLLKGVTGSGKTHIYMDLIDEAIAAGNQALFLVPEIALTAQLIQRLRTKYGKNIGIYHSKFNADERLEIWQKVQHGIYKMVLGVRSALFLPFRSLGLLIVDEEHEHTYKQADPAPRYHARDAGIFLMALHGGKTLLGSATPSFESYFNSKRDKYGLV